MIELVSDTVLVEPVPTQRSPLLAPKAEGVGKVIASKASDISAGSEVLYHPKAGLRLRSNGSVYVLLDTADILAIIEST